MGATITTNQFAAAFKDPGAAHTMWCLFEQHYEKNVYPHTPRWSCIEIGRIDAAVKRIFSAAADCEGGGLQTARGPIRPETYIDRWMNALRNPVVMPDAEIPLGHPEPTGSRWLDEERAAQWTTVRERYKAMRPLHRDAGLNVLDRLDTGEAVSVSLHRHPELVSAVLLGRSWRAFDEVSVRIIMGSQPRSADLGYCPAPIRAAAVQGALPRMLRVDGETRIEKVGGVWKEAGWPYAIVGRYVRGLWEQELNAPGSYKQLIGEYRKAVEATAKVPAGTTVVVPLSSLEASDREVAVKLAGEAGGEVTAGLARIPWVASDSIAPVHFLLSGKDVTWEVPEQLEQEARVAPQAQGESLEQEEMDIER